MCKRCSCKGACCGIAKVFHILLLIGGLNWGLAGLGMLLGTNLNVVYLLLGGSMFIEAIVYLLVGIAALVSIFGCRCKKCKGGMCGPAKSGGMTQPENPASHSQV